MLQKSQLWVLRRHVFDFFLKFDADETLIWGGDIICVVFPPRGWNWFFVQEQIKIETNVRKTRNRWQIIALFKDRFFPSWYYTQCIAMWTSLWSKTLCFMLCQESGCNQSCKMAKIWLSLETCPSAAGLKQRSVTLQVSWHHGLTSKPVKTEINTFLRNWQMDSFFQPWHILSKKRDLKLRQKLFLQPL